MPTVAKVKVPCHLQTNSQEVVTSIDEPQQVYGTV